MQPPIPNIRSELEAITDIIAYHDRTKHHPEQYARGPGFLDWKNQPDPFRRFQGAPLFPLPLAAGDDTPPARALFSAQGVSRRPLTLESLGLFFELSLGLSARKEIPGSSWYLRMNPSSGNLHPTEAYAILPDLAGRLGGAGVYHYAAFEHALEQRARYAPVSPPRSGLFLVGLTSIVWREAWKYGERAFRYCQHDVGHALACLRFAAVALGWRLQWRPQVVDGRIAHWLGLDRKEDFANAEEEVPELLVEVLADQDSGERSLDSDQDALHAALPPTEVMEASGGVLQEREPETPHVSAPFPGGESVQWFGRANRLSSTRVAWPVIDQAIALSERKRLGEEQGKSSDWFAWPAPAPPVSDLTAAQIIRRRRSAVDFDGVTGLSRDRLLAILDTTLPRPAAPPFDAWPLAPRLSLVLFVHRVEGMEPGLYLWLRCPSHGAALRRACRSEFEWLPLPEGAESTPLFRLAQGDLRRFAQAVSCQQEIAADSAFSLGMLAWFEPSLRARGASAYRELFWEAGLIGQALYLGAEAAGLRGTGIGCYLDDLMHRALGLESHDWQSLYHFTIGAPIEDQRLRAQPPYLHLRGQGINPR